jgi:hypothetical protein
MFYPADDLDEIMPDVMVETFKSKVNPHYKNRIGYFTRTARELKKILAAEEESQLEIKSIDETVEGTKGNLPRNVVSHPKISHSFKGASLILSGLDNSFNSRIVNNGSWRP